MYFILLYLIFFVITAHETSKGSRNIRGFALIRAVLLCLVAREGTTQLTDHLILATTFSQMVSFWFYFTTSIPDWPTLSVSGFFDPKWMLTLAGYCTNFHEVAQLFFKVQKWSNYGFLKNQNNRTADLMKAFITRQKLLCTPYVWKKNKTARIRAKPWMFRLLFEAYGAIITWKKLIKKYNDFFLNFRFFFVKISPHMPYKVQSERFRS